LKRRSRKRHLYNRDLVLQRIKILYKIAVEEARKGNIEYSRMLTGLINRLSTRNRVKLPRNVKRGICRNCGAPLIPGVTSRVRLERDGRTSRLVVRCLICGWIHRYPYKPQRSNETR